MEEKVKSVDLNMVKRLSEKFSENVIVSLLNNKLIPATWRVVSELIYFPVESDYCNGTTWLNRLANKYPDLAIDDISRGFITSKLVPSKRIYHVVIVPPHLLTDGERRPDKAKKIVEKKLNAIPQYKDYDVQVAYAPMEVALLVREKLPNYELVNMRLTDIVFQVKLNGEKEDGLKNEQEIGLEEVAKEDYLEDETEHKKRILSVHNFGNKTRVSAYELEQERDDGTGIAFVFELKKKQKQNNQGQGKKKGNWNNQKPKYQKD